MGDPQRHVGVDPLTAEAHICSCNYGMGYEPVIKANMSFNRQRSLP